MEGGTEKEGRAWREGSQEWKVGQEEGKKRIYRNT